MKSFALLFIAIGLFSGCRFFESSLSTNSSQIVKSSKARIEELTPEQRKKLDQRIPPEVREILDKADKIIISYDVDEQTMRFKILPRDWSPNASANVSDPAVKKEFLESFYTDAASNSNGNSCFSPRQRLNAEYKAQFVEIDLCYECGRFRGKSSTGEFSGTLSPDSENRSLALIDAIIEKYGAKIR